MISSSSLGIIAAAADKTLLERATAIAAALGVAAPDYDIQRLRRELTIQEVRPDGATIASIYESAQVAREFAQMALDQAIAEAQAKHPLPPEPGMNLAAVTDLDLETAIRALVEGKKMTASMPPIDTSVPPAN